MRPQEKILETYPGVNICLENNSEEIIRKCYIRLRISEKMLERQIFRVLYNQGERY